MFEQETIEILEHELSQLDEFEEQEMGKSLSEGLEEELRFMPRSAYEEPSSPTYLKSAEIHNSNISSDINLEYNFDADYDSKVQETETDEGEEIYLEESDIENLDLEHTPSPPRNHVGLQHMDNEHNDSHYFGSSEANTHPERRNSLIPQDAFQLSTADVKNDTIDRKESALTVLNEGAEEPNTKEHTSSPPFHDMLIEAINECQSLRSENDNLQAANVQLRKMMGKLQSKIISMVI
jgi:hypothetical protein